MILKSFFISLVVVWSLSLVQLLYDPTDCIACQAPLSMAFPQARILEWIAIPFSRGSSQHRDQTPISHIAGGFFTTEPPGKPFISLLEIQLSYSTINLKWVH